MAVKVIRSAAPAAIKRPSLTCCEGSGVEYDCFSSKLPTKRAEKVNFND